MPLTITITKKPGSGEGEHAERHELAHIVAHVASALTDGTSTGDVLKDRSGRVVGEWLYEVSR